MDKKETRSADLLFHLATPEVKNKLYRELTAENRRLQVGYIPSEIQAIQNVSKINKLTEENEELTKGTLFLIKKDKEVKKLTEEVISWKKKLADCAGKVHELSGNEDKQYWVDKCNIVEAQLDDIEKALGMPVPVQKLSAFDCVFRVKKAIADIINR